MVTYKKWLNAFVMRGSKVQVLSEAPFFSDSLLKLKKRHRYALKLSCAAAPSPQLSACASGFDRGSLFLRIRFKFCNNILWQTDTRRMLFRFFAFVIGLVNGLGVNFNFLLALFIPRVILHKQYAPFGSVPARKWSSYPNYATRSRS